MGNDPVPASSTCTLHGPPMIRDNRMFAAFWGGGAAVIDCSDLRDMKLAGHGSPPFVFRRLHPFDMADRQSACEMRRHRPALARPLRRALDASRRPFLARKYQTQPGIFFSADPVAPCHGHHFR